MVASPIITAEEWGPYWRAKCKCGWDSKDLPFPDPDAAFHCGHLHRVLCTTYPFTPEEQRQNTERFKRKHHLA